MAASGHRPLRALLPFDLEAHNLSHEVTIILIAHRLTTVRECDRIYLLRSGRVIAQGTYDELVEGDETFRAMTGGN